VRQPARLAIKLAACHLQGFPCNLPEAIAERWRLFAALRTIAEQIQKILHK